MKRTIATLSLFLLTITVFAQSAGAPAFEVASVKRDPGNAGSHTYAQYLPGGRLSTLIWMKYIIQIAYGMKDYQVTGGPGWMTSDWYSIEAKAANPDATKGDVNTMLQTLLAERFKLKFHEVTKEFDTFDLVVDKSGAKLTPLAAGEASKCSRDNSVVCGYRNPTQLAGWLTSFVGYPVADKTGITGSFDVLLDFDTYSASGKTPPEGYDKPSLSAALREQLGLRLEPHKEPLPVMVVDSIERPSEN